MSGQHVEEASGQSVVGNRSGTLLLWRSNVALVCASFPLLPGPDHLSEEIRPLVRAGQLDRSAG